MKIVARKVAKNDLTKKSGYKMKEKFRRCLTEIFKDARKEYVKKGSDAEEDQE